MRIKGGRSVRLLNATKLAAWETEYEHWLYTLLHSTGRRLQAWRQTSPTGAFSRQVGASLARKAVRISQSGGSEAEKIKRISRIFADETAQLVAHNILKIISGTGVFDQAAVDKFLEIVAYNELIQSARNIVKDMDQLADIVFER